ncbi:mechanosensitive ion channel family protein [Ramlibacter albus]|uniref:Small-conductance mechanosensitive channel n=1 Tax=Ramlibacter albus TaxID=2079448 RepID=A0A923M741_9BURK|nr:mechanosensitive ion channel family protein [Ramlibacter albus]MBC5764575.1 mechanosensitive ion channel family protein [Ramlibacter albus]
MDLTAVETFLRVTALELVLKILAAIAFWVVGRWIIVRVVAIVQAALNRKQLDPTLGRYLGTIIKVTLEVVLVIGILGYFGVQTASFAALLAGAGLAIGAAWSGLLGNFAAGAFMLMLRPFKVGDFVSVAGITGTVHELGMFGISIITPDNVLTMVGNGKVFAETIQNFSTLPYRRVDRTAQLSGAVDPVEACARLREAVARVPNVMTSPAPEVNVLDLNGLGSLIAVRPYTSNEHYWQVYFDTNETIARTCKEAGWPAPVPVTVTRVQQVA